tara:strand:+ start:237 stop:725 length:489 start_codon:yes stop_codon:yes gene_type:complete
MALKGDRYEGVTDISFFMNETATRGGVVCLKTPGGSGAAMDQGKALVTYHATASGQAPLGILLNDMVNIDQTRQHINFHKNEVQKGGKVTVLKQGYVVTSTVYPGVTPTAGDIAYVSHSGYITNSKSSGSVNAGQAIGRFLSNKDEDGYWKVEVNLPNNGQG